jgi:hypothetical protein
MTQFCSSQSSLLLHTNPLPTTRQVLGPGAFYPFPIQHRDSLFVDPAPCPAISRLAEAVSNGSLALHWWRHSSAAAGAPEVRLTRGSVLGRVAACVCPLALAAQGDAPLNPSRPGEQLSYL